VPVIRLGVCSGPVNQRQNGLGSPVKWIASFWRAVRFWCEPADCLWHTGSAITHRTAPYVTRNGAKEHLLGVEAIAACG
jgi:hypothetical protein